jgi:hypothetical protein
MPSFSQKPRHSLLTDGAGLSRSETVPYFSPPTMTGLASSSAGRCKRSTNQRGASNRISGPSAATEWPELSVHANRAMISCRARAFTICSITE